MLLNKFNLKKIFIFSSFYCSIFFLFTGCMTSSRQEQLQSSMDKLEERVAKIQSQLSTKDQQLNNTAQTVLASENETQGLHDQLQLTQGAVDEIKNRLKKMEDSMGENTNSNSNLSSGVINLSNNGDVISSLQKQIARLDLISNTRLTYTRKAKLPIKIKTNADLDKSLKTLFDAANFKQVIDLATSILLAADATEQMLLTALDYRGEARFQLHDYKGAAIDLATITDLSTNFPRKGRAYLLAGDSYVYLKNNLIALLYYQDCEKKFPSTPEGKAAASRLASLTAQIHASVSPN